MPDRIHRRTSLAHVARACAAALALAVSATPAAPAEPSRSAAREKPEARPAKPKLDRSGRKQVGTASVYARRLSGRRMADGRRLDTNDDVAASKTLPLGTEAKVTNLETGRSAKVKIQDRGPYVKGRIVDLTPATAKKIGISPKEGVAKVEVAPTAVPPADDGAKQR
jgi:rare lipoprotein A